jgi:diguanylate cyclase (GGDEF)-like protein/PAS domain S-box-containing protein
MVPLGFRQFLSGAGDHDMFRVFTCLTEAHDWRLVVLSGAVCLLASLSAISMFQRARATRGRARAVWIVMTGAAAGSGIWATHFVAMLAYDPGVAVAYDALLTGLSLVVAAAITTVGVTFALYGSHRFAAPIGGGIVGGGVAAMHYLGMWALAMPGQVTWSLDLVAASILLGVLFGAAALALAVRREDARGAMAAALLLTLAIVSLHFTAMGAVVIVPNPAIGIDGMSFSPHALALAVAGTTAAILGMCMVGAVVDRRMQGLVRVQEQRLDVALNNMTQGLVMFDAAANVVVINRRYLEMYRLEADAVRPGCPLRQVLELRKAAGTFSDDPDAYIAGIRHRVAEGKPFRRTMELADGRVIALLNQPLANGGWVVTHEDITDRHELMQAHQRAEEQLRQQKMQLDTALNNMTQGLNMFDSEGRLVVYNERYLQMYRLSPDVVKPGCTMHDLVQYRMAAGTFFSVAPDEYESELLGSMNNREPASATLELSDGRMINVTSQPTTRGNGWVVTHEDVTERYEFLRAQERAEAQLLEQHLRLDAALNNMNQGLVMFDASGRLVVCNDRYMQMYELSPEIVRPGCTVRQLLEHRAARGTFSGNVDEYLNKLLSTVDDGKTSRVTVELNDGRIIDVVNQPIAAGGWVATHEDITERRKAERELARTHKFLDTVIENVPTTIVVKNADDRRYILINRAGEKLFGLRRTEMIGKTAFDIYPENVAERVTARDSDVLTSGGHLDIEEMPFHTPGNETRLITGKRLAIRGNDGKPQYMMAVIEDVTERKRVEAQMAHMANHDALTGLFNRPAFIEAVTTTLDKAAEDRDTFAVLSIDLAGFKEVNDQFGYSIGDAVLRELSRRLEASAESAFLARVGGDEFTVISTSGPQPAAASTLADRLLATVADDLEVGGHSIRVGMSIGIAVYPDDGEDTATLLASADAALGWAMAEGSGSIRFFESDMDKKLRERRSLQHDLRTATARNEFVLYYQPQAKVDGEIIGFEALVRWYHPARGIVPPGIFIPVAEESGLIVEMGQWILREACREAASWPRPLQIAINLSPVQFQHGDLPTLVHEILFETGLDPRRLELEITEGVLIGDHSRAMTILRRLKLLGVRIAMDDFGTGYSSLSYLQSFPFDKIKIDQSFIFNLEKNTQSAAIVRAVIGLGRGLGLPVLAEGVETDAQLAYLAREACAEVQGYLVGRPRPIQDYADMVGREVAGEVIAAAG